MASLVAAAGMRGLRVMGAGGRNTAFDLQFIATASCATAAPARGPAPLEDGCDATWWPPSPSSPA